MCITIATYKSTPFALSINTNAKMQDCNWTLHNTRLLRTASYRLRLRYSWGSVVPCSISICCRITADGAEYKKVVRTNGYCAFYLTPCLLRSSVLMYHLNLSITDFTWSYFQVYNTFHRFSVKLLSTF